MLLHMHLLLQVPANYTSMPANYTSIPANTLLHMHLLLQVAGSALLTKPLCLLTKPLRSFWQRHSLQPLRARDHIVRSFCPQICGMYKVKLALLLALIGGVPRYSVYLLY